MKQSDIYMICASIWIAAYKPNVFNLILGGVLLVGGLLLARKGK